MKQSQAKEYLPFIQAAAEGKTIQWNSQLDGCWKDLGEIFTITGSPASSLRIKPEPKRSDWTDKTFPVNCVLKLKDGTTVYRACSWDERGICIILEGEAISTLVKFDILTDFYLYSINGTTWHPCGITDNA